MFSNLQIRPAKPHRRKPSLATRAGVTKRRVSALTLSSPNHIPSMSFLEGLFGDEFPETFATGRGNAQSNRKSILDLPAELLTIIYEHVSKLDIKRLRLASKILAAKVDLRIDRVYISPNRANLACLQRILEHPRYSRRVREMVWDDAQLDEYSTLDSFRCAIELDEGKLTRDIESRIEDALWTFEDDPEYHDLDHDSLFDTDGRLTAVAKGILLRCDDRFSRDAIARNALRMSIEESYSLYQKMYHEERDLIKREIDIIGFHRALKSLPALKRITLTSEIWRPWDVLPRYDTPFYRSLPPGFLKPSVWPWLGWRPQATPAQTAHREHVLTQRVEGPLTEFRGYNSVVSALASISNSTIEEFIIDAGTEDAGISHQLFASHHPTLQDTVRMVCRNPLKRLQLVLNSWGAMPLDSSSYLNSSSLEKALSGMQHLEHLELNLNYVRRDRNNIRPIELQNILSHGILRNLKTLTLRNMLLHESALYNVLQKLEHPLKVTLYHIRLAGRASWSPFFRRLKMHCAQHPAPLSPTGTNRPSFTVIETFDDYGHDTFRAHLVDEEIDAFLYGDGECPFQDGDGQQLQKWAGWIVDDRDETFKYRMEELRWNAAGGGFVSAMAMDEGS